MKSHHAERIGKVVRSYLPPEATLEVAYDDRWQLWYASGRLPNQHQRRIEISQRVVDSEGLDWDAMLAAIQKLAEQCFAYPTGCVIQVLADGSQECGYRLHQISPGPV